MGQSDCPAVSGVRASFAICLLILTAPVVAQNLDLTSFGDLSEFEPGHDNIAKNGVESPTVAFDASTGEYVMLFDTRLDPLLGFYDPMDYPDCDTLGSSYVWGIGRATSLDGTNWIIDEVPLALPDPESPYKCALLHPTLLFDGTQFHAFFLGVDIVSELGRGPAGINRYLIHATSADGLNFTIVAPSTIVRPEIDFPSVMRINDEFLLMITNGAGNNFKAYGGSSVDGNTWNVDWNTPIFDESALNWGQQEMFSPALTCDEDDANGKNLQVFVAARDSTPPNPPAGLAFAKTANFFVPQQWTLVNSPVASAPLIDWDDSNCEPANSLCLAQSEQWRHFDVLRVDDQFVVYASYKHGGVGRNYIEMYYSTPTSDWPEASVRNRICTVINPTIFNNGFEE